VCDFRDGVATTDPTSACPGTLIENHAALRFKPVCKKCATRMKRNLDGKRSGVRIEVMPMRGKLGHSQGTSLGTKDIAFR
jgi:hypothetical protein